jgi:hypothetical protein
MSYGLICSFNILQVQVQTMKIPLHLQRKQFLMITLFCMCMTKGKYSELIITFYII